MHYPKISIVTPSFNQGKFIEQTILSVLDQEYPNLEYIIIDGGSTDETLSVIRKYESRLAYWVSEPDLGQADAINKGFEKATGEIFNWINSDDYYEPGSFQKIARAFSKDPAIDVVCGKEWGFDDAGKVDRVLHPGSIIDKDVFETIRIGIIDQPCTFFRREKIRAYFPLCTGFRYVMDRQLWCCYLLEHGQQNIIKTEDIYTHFRLHPGSKSVSEGTSFEEEFNGLKYSLLEKLNAPAVLTSQLPAAGIRYQVNWPEKIKQPQRVLAAFAFFYAQRCYVKEDMETTARLMKLVKRFKGWEMKQAEQKLWVLACRMPVWALMMLKRMKKAI